MPPYPRVDTMSISSVEWSGHHGDVDDKVATSPRTIMEKIFKENRARVAWPLLRWRRPEAGKQNGVVCARNNGAVEGHRPRMEAITEVRSATRRGVIKRAETPDIPLCRSVNDKLFDYHLWLFS